MISNALKKLYETVVTDPCKKCLVKMQCLKRWGPSNPCDKYRTYVERRENIKIFGYNIEIVFMCIIALCGIFFIAATFGLGIWKWMEVIF
jgi:hypothetical protein